MSPADPAAVERLLASRRAQGLGEQITDPVALDRLATLLAVKSIPARIPTGANNGGRNRTPASVK